MLNDRWTKSSHEISVVLQNPIDDAAVLSDFEVSCGCAIPVFDTTHFKGKQSRAIKISLDGHRLAGNSPLGGEVSLAPVFTTAEGIEKKVVGDTVLIRFDLESPAQFSPPSVVMSPEQTRTAEITFARLGFEIGPFDVPDWLVIDQSATDKERNSRLTLEATGSRSGASMSSEINIPVLDRGERKEIGEVRLGVQLLSRRSVRAIPDVIQVERNEEQIASVKLLYDRSAWSDMRLSHILAPEGITIHDAVLEKKPQASLKFKYSVASSFAPDVPVNGSVVFNDSTSGNSFSLRLIFVCYSDL